MPILGSIIKKAYELRNIPIDQKKRKQTDPYQTQLKQLKKLLKKAQFTSFGEYFDFAKILHYNDAIKTFQQKIPIYDYNTMFRKWWYRALNGEAFVSWPGRVKYFALTSGTSEASSKQVPVTGDMIRAAEWPRGLAQHVVLKSPVSCPARNRNNPHTRIKNQKHPWRNFQGCLLLIIV